MNDQTILVLFLLSLMAIIITSTVRELNKSARHIAFRVIELSLVAILLAYMAFVSFVLLNYS